MGDESSEKRNVCFAVNTTRGDEALMMCLSSVLFQTRVPDTILINFNGPFPSFGKYYLEQLTEFARLKGIGLTIGVSRQLGVRAARQRVIETTRHLEDHLLWMGDDDVIYEPFCLQTMLEAYDGTSEKGTKKVYIQGSKPDLNNRRSYGDFKSEIFTSPDELKTKSVHEVSPNRFYDPEAFYQKAFATSAFDTGNVFFSPSQAHSDGATFEPFDDTPKNVGGEDTLFGAQLRSKGWTGYLVPSAIGVHLESPASTKPWDVMKERGEMLQRSAEQLGLDKDELRKSFAPWVYE